ncbi:MAG TPA: adenylate/guanylate cyclase domain-containing protein, partial [Chloroflexia bacterium]|nr:adenylate/guanylate cyclase domain-containing protein [Chloroflexia bacterium]
MPTTDPQATQLEEAISRLEAQRALLGDAVVNLTLDALRAQLATLRAAQPATPDLRPDRRLALLHSYLPRELADKMRASRRIESERKQVTVVFAEIGGLETSDAGVAALANEALRDMAEAVYQYEGYIDKFVGEAVMVVFGAPVAHEDDADRALRTALAMR